jgi:hypothetical protein
MQILNALQLVKGKTRVDQPIGTLTQPLQMIPLSEKSDIWLAQNIDWIERKGMTQIEKKAKRLLRNYKHANGELDVDEYIPEDSEDYQYELLNHLDAANEEEQALELKYYPIIPNVINIMVGEFAKRSDKISYQNVDDLSFNEMLEDKRQMIEDVLLGEAEEKISKQLQAMGMDMQSEEAQQELSPEKLKTLPEIEEFFTKDYKSLYEQWATHQHEVDVARFTMDEQEITGFKDSLISDSEYWHLRMNSDDYDVELLNPVTTFEFRAPGVKYTSNGQAAGFIELLSVSDVIDKFGYMMGEGELYALRSVNLSSNAAMMDPGVRPDTAFYDSSQTHEENMEKPSVAMRQFQAVNRFNEDQNMNLFDRALSEGKTMWDSYKDDLVRVTTCYWKSMKKVGYYTGIMNGSIITDFVDESFEVTHKPKFDKTFTKEESADNLIDGEFIEWIWINETYGGTKIGPNFGTTGFSTDSLSFRPIYLNVKPLPFQFNGDNDIYGCKLPIEGTVFSDRNSKSISLVDKIKPFQVGYNLVNNQIADILIDELGTVLLFDQNTLPKHSMGEDWGDGNYEKAYMAMKDFSMLPLNHALSNTQSPINFNQIQRLDMSQTSRLLGRIELSNHFKFSALDAVGISMQRAGAVNAQETATGVEQAINMSYVQTEIYFVNHAEHLMPRVHEMRTNLAQYYHSNNPSVRLSYVTSKDEKVFFEINGTELLGRQFNCYATTKVNEKYLMEQIRNLAIQNNTSGASIFDLGNLIKATSMAEIDHILKRVEDKMERQLKEEQESRMAEVDKQVEAQNNRTAAEIERDDRHHYSQLDNNLDVAKVRSAGFQVGDNDNNGQSDFIDTLKYLQEEKKQGEAVRLQNREMSRKETKDLTDRSLKEKELALKERDSERKLQIAKTNKNRYDS